mgnify:CR=1 FL=1
MIIELTLLLLAVPLFLLFACTSHLRLVVKTVVLIAGKIS